MKRLCWLQVLKNTLNRLAVSAHVFTDEPLLASLELLFAAPPGFIPAKVGPFFLLTLLSDNPASSLLAATEKAVMVG